MIYILHRNIFKIYAKYLLKSLICGANCLVIFLTYIFMYFVICPSFVSNGVLFNDLALYYTGAELLAMKVSYIGMF